MNHILIFIFLFYPLFSQKYEKDISTNEKRIAEYKKEGNYPGDWKLFFKTKESDYIVFYDLDGNEVYFKYRRDALDREAERKTVGLFIGQAYRIKGRLIGIIMNYHENDKKNFYPPVFLGIQDCSEENKKSIHNKLVYQFISFESTSLDEVLK